MCVCEGVNEGVCEGVCVCVCVRVCSYIQCVSAVWIVCECSVDSE